MVLSVSFGYMTAGRSELVCVAAFDTGSCRGALDI